MVTGRMPGFIDVLDSSHRVGDPAGLLSKVSGLRIGGAGVQLGRKARI